MPRPSNTVELDDFDRKIVSVLMEDGRITVTDLAQRVGLSKTPCQVRLRKLIDSGVILGFRAVVDPAKNAARSGPRFKRD